MAIYAVAITLLIREISLRKLSQIWSVNNAAGGDKLSVLREWLDKLADTRPRYGYEVNATKTWLIVKE